jgi:hypothetical protein
VGLEVRDRSLHRLGRLQDERELHLAGGEQLADRLHAGQQDVVDDPEGSKPGLERLLEVVLEPVAVAVDDALLEAALDRPVQILLAHWWT